MRALVATCRGEWPNTSIWPLVGYSRPRINLTVVDLPEPFGPSRPNTSPRRTSKSTLSTARALGRFQKSLKTFVRPRTVTMTSFECGVRSAECGVGSAREVVIVSFGPIRQFAEDGRQAGLIQTFVCDVNHCRVNGTIVF